jgi:hypothetical protein
MSTVKVFTVGYSAAASFSSAFTFPDGISKAYLEVPTFSSGTDIYLAGSTDGSTYRRIMQEVPQTSSVQVNTFTIASSASGRLVPVPVAAPYLKVEPTTAPSTAVNFKIICHYI